MDIQITTKKQNHLKRILKVTNVKPIIQKVINDWIEYTIRAKYKSKKSVDDIINEDN